HSLLYPPYLSSFPTRRSSDLSLSTGTPLNCPSTTGALTGAGIATSTTNLLATSPFAVTWPPGAATQSFQPDDYISFGIKIDNLLDRKSTRLNSSHLVISYAVF